MDIGAKLFLVLLIFIVVVFNLYCSYALATDPLMSAIDVSASALRAQSERLKIISQNIANEDSTGNGPGSTPYQRKTITFKRKLDRKTGSEIIKVDKYGTDPKEFKKKYDPSHPAADKDGYVLYPNVDKSIEFIDAKEAQRSFDANLNVIDISKSMMSKTLEILR
jgi:flagellar basal-body rod protein FlgC